MKALRDNIAFALKTVTNVNSPRVYDAIQTELGYKNVEDKIIHMMLNYNMSASATIPHLENEM